MTGLVFVSSIEAGVVARVTTELMQVVLTQSAR
jgi:hypothetical protein